MEKRKLVFTELFLTLLLCSCGSAKEVLTDEQLYANAVKDAIIAEDSEILPLVTLTEHDSQVIYSEKGYELVTFNKYPSSYPDGQEMEISDWIIWSVSYLEFTTFVKNNAQTTDWSKRIHQVMGMPLSANETHLTTFYVNGDAMLRPAFNSDVTAQITTTRESLMAEDEEYKAWFNQNIISSYYSSQDYPWTRLGYTYDWGDNGQVYGLSEFITSKGCPITVHETKTIEECVDDILHPTNSQDLITSSRGQFDRIGKEVL